jgi:tight adherence protein B
MVSAAVLLAAIFLGAATLAIFMGLGRMIESEDSVKTRLDVMSPLPTSASADRDAQGNKVHPLARALNRIISGRAFATSITAELARANMPLTVPEYVLLNIASMATVGFIVLLLVRQLILALMGAAVGLMVPRVYIQRRQSRRLQAFQDQLPDILTLLVGSLRSGYGITIAMDTVARQMPPPAAEEFSRVVREIGLGLPTTQALANLVRRVRSDDLDLVVTAIAIQYEVGGNLATILETITDTIRERVRLKGQLRVLTAQQALQRYILTALPLVLAVIIYVLNPLYMRQLFTPGITLIIPISAAVLMVLGYVVMGKLSIIQF